MTSTTQLSRYFDRLESLSAFRWHGRVTQVIGQVVESEGPFGSSGDSCQILTSGSEILPGQIIGFRGSTVLIMTFKPPEHVRFGDDVVSWGTRPLLRVGGGLIGRVLNAFGEPIDSKGSCTLSDVRELERAAPPPFERELIREALGSGIRAIDGFLVCGQGQRLGIFGGSGVGKSTLLGMMARNTHADVTVVALVGERGREVREFLERSLGVAGLSKSVVVVSTSDQSPLMRVRAAFTATAIAEHFAAQSKHVLLFVDSLTRLAMAQREIGLATGEPPTSKGYTPSVLALLARLIERAGKFRTGSITGFYTVLMEGDDEHDPIVDSTRALLDGHIMLDRRLASQNHFPPISILDSISRLMPAVCSQEHFQKASELRRLLAAYRASEDLVRIGAYQAGNDAALDAALTLLPSLTAFLQQKPDDAAGFEQTLAQLLALGA